jgi:hypothetical protein
VIGLDTIVFYLEGIPVNQARGYDRPIAHARPPRIDSSSPTPHF